VQLRILDDAGHELPAGQSGRLYVRQEALTEFSYVGDDAARRAMEVDGHLTMGDVGYLDDEGAADVQAFLKARLAGYKVPSVVSFHAELPREDTGKIFKRLLREPYWQGAGRRI
jgi:acyl-coenzyme A synthetase/AMP-(fatty) acid ligase